MQSVAKPKIVAVTVTYNRVEMVTRLLRAVAQQTVLPDLMIVVDNCSTDDTVSRVSDIDFGVPIQVIVQSENTGGAGGFAAGISAAQTAEAQLIWLMDDDGYPASNCLELLLAHPEFDFLGPAVVTDGAPEQLCFPIRVPGSAKLLRTTAELAAASPTGLLAEVVIPFNGVLLTAELVEKIGNVTAKYFIWGDDVEYLWRAQSAAAQIATVTAARFYHPATDQLGSPMVFGKLSYNHSPSDLKHYCMSRNNFSNLRQYRGNLAALAFVAKTSWFYTFTKPSLARLRLSFRGIVAGWRQDFTHHKDYL